MNKSKALEVLIEYQKWRRAEGKYSEAGATMPHSPKEIGEAIDVAIDELSHKKEGCSCLHP